MHHICTTDTLAVSFWQRAFYYYPVEYTMNVHSSQDLSLPLRRRILISEACTEAFTMSYSSVHGLFDAVEVAKP